MIQISLGDRLYKARHRYLPKIKRRYVRFYGRYRTVTGQLKGFEYQVRVSERTSNKTLSKLITHICNKTKRNTIPQHRKGETFPSFHEVFNVPWIRVRKVMDYDVTVRS